MGKLKYFLAPFLSVGILALFIYILASFFFFTFMHNLEGWKFWAFVPGIASVYSCLILGFLFQMHGISLEIWDDIFNKKS